MLILLFLGQKIEHQTFRNVYYRQRLNRTQELYLHV